MVPFERALVSLYNYALHSNFSSTLMRVGGIVAFVLQHAPFPDPTSSLPQISPCSRLSRWIFFGLRRARVLG